MTRHQPETYILHSGPITDRHGKPVMGIRQPLKTAAGKFVGTNTILMTPTFREVKPMGEIVHWRNEAARRRWNGDYKAAHADKEGYKEKGRVVYGRQDLVVVPLFRGISARQANEFRAINRKEARERERQTIMARIRETIKNMTTKPADGEGATA